MWFIHIHGQIDRIYTGVYKQVKNLHDIILQKLHPIIYTARNFLFTPKANKGTDTTSQLRETWLHTFKSSDFCLSQLPKSKQVEPQSKPFVLFSFSLSSNLTSTTTTYPYPVKSHTSFTKNLTKWGQGRVGCTRILPLPREAVSERH